MTAMEEFDLKIENVDYEMVKKSFTTIIDDGNSLVSEPWNDDKTEYNECYSDEELNNFLTEIGGERMF